jgi:hypothetical protein
VFRCNNETGWSEAESAKLPIAYTLIKEAAPKAVYAEKDASKEGLLRPVTHGEDSVIGADSVIEADKAASATTEPDDDVGIHLPIHNNGALELQSRGLVFGPSDLWNSADQDKTVEYSRHSSISRLSVLDSFLMGSAEGLETDASDETEEAENVTTPLKEPPVNPTGGDSSATAKPATIIPAKKKFRVQLSVGALKRVHAQNEQEKKNAEQAKASSEAGIAVTGAGSAVGLEPGHGTKVLGPEPDDKVAAHASLSDVTGNKRQFKLFVFVFAVVRHWIQLQWTLFILDLETIVTGPFALVLPSNLARQCRFFLRDLQNVCNVFLRLAILVLSLFVNLRFDASGHIQTVALGWFLNDFYESKGLLLCNFAFVRIPKLLQSLSSLGPISLMTAKSINLYYEESDQSDQAEFEDALNAMAEKSDMDIVHGYVRNCRIRRNLLKALYFALDFAQINDSAELIKPFISSTVFARLPAWKVPLLIDIYHQLENKQAISQQIVEFKGSSIDNERLKQLLSSTFSCREFNEHMHTQLSAKGLAYENMRGKYAEIAMDEHRMAYWVSLFVFYSTSFVFSRSARNGLHQKATEEEPSTTPPEKESSTTPPEEEPRTTLPEEEPRTTPPEKTCTSPDSSDIFSGILKFFSHGASNDSNAPTLSEDEGASLEHTVLEPESADLNNSDPGQAESIEKTKHSSTHKPSALLFNYYLNADKALEDWIFFNNITS